MTLKSPSPKEEKSGRYGASSLYLAVPTLLAASILVGFFLGQWADRKFGTEPFLMIVGLVLGMAAAGRELYRLVKKAQALEDEETGK
ncbi:MAG: AtpZ/AtpI family protein [candidate division Zixibacteria bacterium]|nr:AtpZ/AtpI family protein [candidate division Zixibacteria bacterium]